MGPAVSDAGPEGDVSVEAIRTVLLEAAGVNLPENELGGLNRLHDAIAVDSVALLEFVVALEEKFSISIEPEWLDLERLMDLPRLADYVRGRIAGRGSDGR